MWQDNGKKRVIGELLVSSYEGAGWRELILREYERLAGAEVDMISAPWIT